MNARLVKGLVNHYLLGKPVPLIVTHIITYKCNLKCDYCGVWKQESKELSTKQTKELIDWFARHGTVSWEISGGEPLLRQDIGEIINHAKSRGMLVSMNTNGHLFEEKAESIKNLDSIVFSIDGDEKTHDKIKGEGSYQKTVRALKLAKEKGFETIISTVISKTNHDKLKHVLRLAEKNGAKIGFQPVHSDAYTGDVPLLAKEEFSKARTTIEEFMDENPGIVHHSKQYLGLMQATLFEGKKVKCFAGKLFYNLLPDGSLTPCWFKQEKKINPLTQGTERLEVREECSCTPLCYLRYNALFSFHPSEVVFFLERFSRFL